MKLYKLLNNKKMRVTKIKNEGAGKLYTDYEMDYNDQKSFVEDWNFNKEEAAKLCDYLKSSGQVVTTSYNDKTALSFTLLGVTLSLNNAPSGAMKMLNDLESKTKTKKKKEEQEETKADTGILDEKN